MKRGGVDVGYVHAHLRDAVFGDIPADGLGAFECAGNHHGLPVGTDFWLVGYERPGAFGASFLAHVECNGVGTSGRGDKEVAGTDNRGTRACHFVVEGTGAEVRCLAGGVGTCGKGLVFTFAAYGKVLALRRESRRLIAINRDT